MKIISDYSRVKATLEYLAQMVTHMPLMPEVDGSSLVTTKVSYLLLFRELQLPVGLKAQS